jgi:hypothetical protein
VRTPGGLDFWSTHLFGRFKTWRFRHWSFSYGSPLAGPTLFARRIADPEEKTGPLDPVLPQSFGRRDTWLLPGTKAAGTDHLVSQSLRSEKRFISCRRWRLERLLMSEKIRRLMQRSAQQDLKSVMRQRTISSKIWRFGDGL